ncbi:type 4a pilus biogenesis protein PilO [Patescibacteria group bacterium]|nr:type 4a pilus biogenesis protein PilO [Patescibacteria group bacterium]MBU4022829.1 type 4a pilus biogenesis protein PilO [Patescibacteria group bacterium]MBU4078434.1 type 4a pilus biogenesis protein PilO [Patescibacteria group bacterium]
MKYSLTIISISLVISIIIGAIFLYPKYQKFSQLQNQITEKEEELASQQNYLKILGQINEKVKERQDLIDKVTSAIPDEPDIPSFLNFLKQEAVNTGVGLEQVSWSKQVYPKDEKKQTNDYLVNLDVSGSYFAFRNFLFALENNARLIEVLSADFSLDYILEEPTVFGLELKIHSY